MFKAIFRSEESRAPAAQEERFAALRRAMVDGQIRRRGIASPRVLEAFLTVPRHEFVPHQLASMAYSDGPLSIGEGQTISQPFMVAAMTAALELGGDEKVLEVGTGSGYQAALLSLLSREVHSVERNAQLAQSARERLARLGYPNITVHERDGTEGLPELAPFDAILVTAASPSIPPPLIEQLGEGGRLVIPVGDAQQQECLLVRKRGDEIRQSVLHYCRFVPLVGRYGWGTS